jgi:hypothetical protein
MSPERAFNLVVDAAVVHWSMDTRQAELREALDKVLEQLGDTTLRRALESRWRKKPPPPRAGVWAMTNGSGVRCRGTHRPGLVLRRY